MLATMRNPLVDVLAHPWWFSRVEFEPGSAMEWFTDMSHPMGTPRNGLAAMSVETGTPSR